MPNPIASKTVVFSGILLTCSKDLVGVVYTALGFHREDTSVWLMEGLERTCYGI